MTGIMLPVRRVFKLNRSYVVQEWDDHLDRYVIISQEYKRSAGAFSWLGRLTHFSSIDILNEERATEKL